MIADPLSWLFSQLVRARNARYDSGRAPVSRLRLPVISVGNLSVGGSGKTPFVQTLGRWLTAQGIGYDVLSRGYRRRSRGVLRVDPAGPASLYGDEPLLLARTLEAPVFVGEDRYLAGLAAEAWALDEGRQEHGSITKLHILDDGFQHRRLHRDFDIVLLGHGDLRASLLPFGRLREPLSALGRADAVAAPEDLAALLTEPNVWHIRRRLVLNQSAPTRPLAFCGLAQPQQFWQSLADIGVHPVATYAFGDHHRYTAGDIALLKRLAQQHEANGFVTTEKDMVKLDASELGKVCAPQLTIELANADAKFKAMLETTGVQ
jgi:tetraacyldisaccharide 4'-kinase